MQKKSKYVLRSEPHSIFPRGVMKLTYPSYRINSTWQVRDHPDIMPPGYTARKTNVRPDAAETDTRHTYTVV